MHWSSNGAQVKASLNRRFGAADGKVKQAADQALLLGKNEIHTRCPRKTGNLDSHYETDSKVTKKGEAHYECLWTSIALSANNYNYQPIVEFRRPHLSPGVHAAIPQIESRFKEIMNG